MVRELQAVINRLGTIFRQTVDSTYTMVEVPAFEVSMLPSSLSQRMKEGQKSFLNPHNNTMFVPSDVQCSNAVLRWSKSPEVRKKMYYAANSDSVENLKVRGCGEGLW
jgi:Zn-dependent oligopeptidase